MNSIVIRCIIIYLFVFVILRLAGKRTLSELKTFDLVLLLILSEATQSAMMNSDNSILGAMIAIGTLIFIDVAVSFFSSKSRDFDRIINGVPMIILKNGTPIRERMEKARVQTDDILEAARKTHGLESLSQIKYAVLEKGGEISIIPAEK